jgi:autotransporter-associated beta strand protein
MNTKFSPVLSFLSAVFLLLGGLPMQPAQGQAFLTWTGTSTNWNNTSRWTGWDSGGFPYGQLQWTGGGDPTSNNNFDPTASAWRLFFNGNTAYTITGNEIRLTDFSGGLGGIMSRATGAQNIQATVHFRDSGDRAMFISTRMGGSGTGGGGGNVTLSNVIISRGVTGLRLSGESGAGRISINGTISDIPETGGVKGLIIGRDYNDAVQSSTFVELRGDNTFGGGVNFRAGTLRLGHNNALGSGTLTIDAEGTSVRILSSTTGSARTIGNNIDLFNALTLGQVPPSGGTGSLNLTGNVFLGNSAGTRAITVNGAHEISGAITGTLRGLDKQGSGTLRLSGANTFGGPINVTAGTLLLDGSNATLDLVTVLSGAAVGGSGSIGGSLAFSDGAKFVFSLTDTLTVNGASVTFGSNGFGIADLIGLDSSVANGTYTIINGTADINTTFLNNLGESNKFDLGDDKFAYFTTGSLQVNVVPEPSTWALVLLAGGGWLVHRLRRRRPVVD